MLKITINEKGKKIVEIPEPIRTPRKVGAGQYLAQLKVRKTDLEIQLAEIDDQISQLEEALK